MENKSMIDLMQTRNWTKSKTGLAVWWGALGTLWLHVSWAVNVDRFGPDDVDDPCSFWGPVTTWPSLRAWDGGSYWVPGWKCQEWALDAFRPCCVPQMLKWAIFECQVAFGVSFLTTSTQGRLVGEEFAGWYVRDDKGWAREWLPLME